MEKSTTLVLGASENPERYSNKAILSLRHHGHSVKAVGLRNGKVADVEILLGKPVLDTIDTVTLYLNPTNQIPYYDYIIQLQPRRVIFNPGTENPDFYSLLQQHHIQSEEACTLVLLATHQF